MSDDLIVLCKYDSLTEAQLAKGWLEASGIDATIQSDDAGGMYPQFQSVRGVKLIIRAEDENDARALLKGDTENE